MNLGVLLVRAPGAETSKDEKAQTSRHPFPEAVPFQLPPLPTMRNKSPEVRI